MKEKINKIYEKINEEFSGLKAKEFAITVSKFHRIQVSPWFSQSVSWCKDILRRYGIKVKIHKLPSDGKRSYFTMRSFKKWSCHRGILCLEKPFKKKIADFEEMKLRVIPRSGNAEGIYEVVYYDGGGRKNLKNKVILTSNRKFIREEFLKKNRVRGVLFFGMTEIEKVRKKEDLMDALQYVSFWPEKENEFFGFILSPREGEYLKNLLYKNRTLKIYTEIKSQFEDGFIEVVDILFKGRTDEEVWGVAHLCHPAPFVNDNASGVGVILELARCFKNIFDKRILKKPLRSIRFLLLPEMTGTYAYLKLREREIFKVKGALNLDMVGEDQEKCKSSFLLIKEPRGIMSYVSYLSELIFEWTGEGYKNFYGSDVIPSLKKKVSEYSGGSDHYILIDPSIGIPCVMLGQWPDRFYHTSQDDEAKISEKSLQFAGNFAGIFLYYLADMGKKEVEELAEKIKFIFLKEIYEERLKERGKDREKILYISFVNALNSLKSIYRGFTPSDFIKDVKEYINLPLTEKRSKGEVPCRKFKAPLSLRNFMKKMTERERLWFEKSLEKKKFLRQLIELFIYYIDGKRSFNEIAELIKIETGKEEKLFLRKFYNLLRKYKFLTPRG